MTGMKIAFFAIFAPNLDPHCGLGLNVELLKQNFNFQLIRNAEAMLFINYVALRLTKLKISKIIIFCHF